MADREVFDVLGEELSESVPELSRALEVIGVSDSSSSDFAEHGGIYHAYLTRLVHAADILEMSALQSVAAFLRENCELLLSLNVADRQKSIGVFHRWPGSMLAFFRTPSEPESIGEVAKLFEESDWPKPLSEEDALGLAEALFTEAGGMDDEGEAGIGQNLHIAAGEITDDDVALGFSEDINPQLIEAFLQETPMLVAKFSESIQQLQNDDGGAEDVLQAQRFAHSIKGSANITGVRGLANITHHAEDVLEFLTDRNELPAKGLANVLVEVADSLEVMVEHLQGLGPPPEQARRILEDLVAWGGRIRDASSSTPPEEEEIPTREIVAAVKRAEEASTLAPVPERLALQPVRTVPVGAQPPPEPTVRVSESRIDQLLRLAGEMATSIVQVLGYHKSLLHQVQEVNEQNSLVTQRLASLQELVEVRGVPAVKRQWLGSTASDIDDPSRFDPLELDEYNELHSATNALAETLTDVRELTYSLREELVELDEMLVQQEQISSELNGAILSARMLPVDSIGPRLQRSVRQACRATGKQAELEISGAQMQIDNSILSSVIDPLMHVLRNAVDHGIESPEARVAAGKPAAGQIRLTFSREGETVVIACRDDGGGFDFDRIREISQERHLLAPGAQPTEAELARLVLLPGFSTRKDATQISGRGIGMDVVHRAISDLRGSVDIRSRTGQGTLMTMRVPLTLISLHVLLVKIGRRVFGVPSSTVEQALFSDAGLVVAEGDGWIFQFGEQEYPVRTLAELLRLRGQGVDRIAQSPVPLLLVHGTHGSAAIVVDAAVDGRYLVVKRLGRFVPRVRGVIGAAILADGGVAPVLDLRELLREPTTSVFDQQALEQLAQDELPDMPNILIVDDSLSSRRTLAQAVTDAGFEARTAVDGIDAIEAIESRLPAAVLLDMEMPRMNGLELAAHLRADENTKGLPLMMITSRSTLKHRNQARAAGIDVFLTKPYQEDDLAERLSELVMKH